MTRAIGPVIGRAETRLRSAAGSEPRHVAIGSTTRSRAAAKRSSSSCSKPPESGSARFTRGVRTDSRLLGNGIDQDQAVVAIGLTLDDLRIHRRPFT